MKDSLKKMVLGLLIGATALGVMTASSRPALADNCEECTTHGFSGYVIATGVTTYCESDPQVYELYGCP